MKLCKDCRWYTPGSDSDLDRCAALHPTHVDLVRGEPSPRGYLFCNNNRADVDKCGHEGAWWEPKFSSVEPPPREEAGHE